MSTKDDIGQGELYSPDHAIKLELNSYEEGEDMGVAADIRRNLAAIKERVVEKLAATALPADALENARHYLESVVKEVTVAAHGLTKDALLRIKTHLVDLLHSLSPKITRNQMVDDAEEAANGQRESEGRREKQDGDHQPSSKTLSRL